MSVGPRREPSGGERAGLAGPPRRDLRPHPRSCGGASDLRVFCSVTRLRRPRALGCEAPFVWPAPFPQRIPFASPLAVPGKEKAGHTHLRPRLRAPRQSLGPSTPLGARSPPSLQDERLAPTLPTPRALPPGCPRREPRLCSQALAPGSAPRPGPHSARALPLRWPLAASTRAALRSGGQSPEWASRGANQAARAGSCWRLAGGSPRSPFQGPPPGSPCPVPTP